jgi:hypothetical protein
VAQGWKPGIEALQLAVKSAPAAARTDAKTDLRYAKAAANHFQLRLNRQRVLDLRHQTDGR